MRFFLDNCLSPRFAAGLRELAAVQRYEIRHLNEVVAREDTPDVEWIGELSRQGDWVIVSGDPRITRGAAEKAAWQEAGLTAFFFTHGWTNKSYWKQAAHLVHWWPTIVLEARRATRGTGFLIPLQGDELRTIYQPNA